MARPATGQVIVDERRRSPTFGLRFRAYGRREYVALGTAAEGWTPAIGVHVAAQADIAQIARADRHCEAARRRSTGLAMLAEFAHALRDGES